MGLLFGLVPFAVYYVLAPLSLSLALWLAFAASFTLCIRTFVASGTIRYLDGAGLVLFGLLALYDAFIDRGATAMRTGMIVETGFFLIALWSLWMRRPFTEQYPWYPGEASWRTKVVLAAIWAVMFAAMAGANATAVFLPTVPPVWTAGAGLAAFAVALTYTWYYAIHNGKRTGHDPILGRR